MQSQQKRVKWSRGETAEALEERTDTGITQASVAYMENCIPDIYGNISRRPALKIIPYSNTCFADYSKFGFSYTRLIAVIPFYITETDYILIGIRDSAPAEFIRISNGVCVYKYVLGINQGGILGSLGTVKSYAQQNNYLLIAGGTKIVKITFSFNSHKFTPNVEFWEYTAGWYAPNGTKTQQVNNVTIPGLAISGQYSNYVFTNIDGTSTVYSTTDTGLDGQANKAVLEEQIPIGSIVHMAKAGCYFRVEGYYTEDDNIIFPDITFDSVSVETVSGTGVECVAHISSNNHQGYLRHYNNGTLVASVKIAKGLVVTVKCSASQTGYSKNSWYVGDLTQGAYWGTWEDADQTDSSVRMYGALMTPVADANATDTAVSVEYGYVSLQPDNFTSGDGTNAIYPHPEQLCFCEQRLWTGSWKIDSSDQYALVIGSQIARYNDLKNDYNQENEPITLDILTKFKERVLHLVDYNGLKIMTDAYEYAYENGGVVKQSANGSWADCEPLVFDSLCLYVDSTGYQVKAMQYEFQSDIFNSSTINQLTPHDLVWNPIGMAAYEDKIHSTGKYLFVVNGTGANTKLAVCNFVPSNQANIWSRWTFPTLLPDNINRLHNVVRLKDNVIFLVLCNNISSETTNTLVLVPAILDFDGLADCIGNVTNSKYDIAAVGTERLTLSNSFVNVYANGVFQFTTTTTYLGAITDDISGLTNVTVGLPINSTIVSHPIDVGGKTKSIKKRIAKARMSVHNTEAGAITINDKTGYMNPAKDYIQFYGVTGMKQEVKYTITNKQGAMFHLESLLMNIEYGTLIS